MGDRGVVKYRCCGWVPITYTYVDMCIANSNNSNLRVDLDEQTVLHSVDEGLCG